MSATITPNMNLLVPAAGDTDYPTSVATTMTAIDTHDHSSGKGTQIVTGGITDLAVTTGKIADLAVTTGKINDLAVTNAKRAALGQQTATLGGSVTISSTTAADVTGLSVSITTTGRPVMIMLYGADITVDALDDSLTHTVNIVGASTLASHVISVKPNGGKGLSYPANLIYVDVPAAGAHTYKIQALKGTFDGSLIFNAGLKLTVYEL